jgi:hypothetical protein
VIPSTQKATLHMSVAVSIANIFITII